MPPALELPEIEILRRESERDIVGRKVKAVDLGALKAFPGHRTKKSISDLLEGEKIKISGFGNFVVREKGARAGRNPQTGQEITISARHVLTFKPSQVLKILLNGEE